jgi:hypothetical protein
MVYREMGTPNHEIVSMKEEGNKEEENAKPDWNDECIFNAKNFLMKVSGKKSKQQEQKEPKTPIDESLKEENDMSALSDIDHKQVCKDVRNFKELG